MRNFSALASLGVAAVLLCLIACSSPKTEVKESSKVPSLVISDLRTKQKIDMQQYRGKVLFVNFWASWCPPCKEEMPSMQALQKELGNDTRFAMITILYKDDPEHAEEYLKAAGYAFPVFADPDGRSARQYGVTGVPETFLIDKKGTLRKHIIGPADWASPEAKTFINTLLFE